MTGAPVLFTRRLMLRAPEAPDLGGWSDMNSGAETMRFIGGTKSRSDAWWMLCAMRGAWHICGFAIFSVIERATGP